MLDSNTSTIPSFKSPIMSWDVSLQLLSEMKKRHSEERSILKQYATDFTWFDNEIFGEFDNDRSAAIILTDKDQNILWVNEKFSSLTGYEQTDVKGKTPKMFQGKKTDAFTKAFIGEQLRKGEAVSKDILNYRKDGTPYWCSIKILPIHNLQNKLVNYIAFEHEVNVA